MPTKRPGRQTCQANRPSNRARMLLNFEDQIAKRSEATTFKRRTQTANVVSPVAVEARRESRPQLEDAPRLRL